MRASSLIRTIQGMKKMTLLHLFPNSPPPQPLVLFALESVLEERKIKAGPKVRNKYLLK